MLGFGTHMLGEAVFSSQDSGDCQPVSAPALRAEIKRRVRSLFIVLRTDGLPFLYHASKRP